jgi:Tol biopolymer transport system component
VSHLPVVPESLYEMKFVEDPRISPDGSMVAFVVAQADPDRNVYDRQIWMASTDGSGPPRAFSSGGAQDYAPRWSPDGRILAFISTRNGSPQLYTIPVDGGEPTQLTDRVDGVRYPRWSPDGSQIAFISSATAEDRALEDRGVIERFDSREVTKAWQ